MDNRPSNTRIWIAFIILLGLIGFLIYVSKVSQEDNQKKIQELIELQQQRIIKQDEINSKLQYIIDNPPKDGLDGSDGLNGYGVDGTNGRDGKDGKSIKGAKGDSAIDNYQLWLQAGNIGTLIDYFDWLKPADGKDAPVFETRYNTETGNYEKKRPHDIFWTIEIPKCAFEGNC